MEQKKKYQHNGGRKPKLDPRTHRYSFNLDHVENAKFLSFFDRSGYTIKAHFIKNCIFGKSFKVTVRDKSKVDYSNFSEKKALALLYRLEQCTLELIKTNEMIVLLSRRFEQSYQREGIISAEE